MRELPDSIVRCSDCLLNTILFYSAPNTGVEWRDQDLVAIITRYRRGNGKVTVVEQNGVWANLRAPRELLLRYRGSNGPERVPVDVSVREALGLCPGCSNIGP